MSEKTISAGKTVNQRKTFYTKILDEKRPRWSEGPGRRLSEPIDAATLAIFRIFFGGILFWEVLRYLPRIDERYRPDAFHFTFPLFESIRPWPGDGMYWHFLLMGSAALCLMFGIFHRLSAFFCLVGFGYVFLIEKAYYLNHFYLVLLLCFLLMLVDAGEALSWDAWRRDRRLCKQIPAWQLMLLRAQILIVYFYGGLAKLNGDWLRGEPLRHWLANKETTPWIRQLLEHDWAAYVFSYGGLIFDLTIGFLLIFRPTRKAGIVGVVAFNLINGWLFQIGIFPWVMIAALILFLEPEEPRRLVERIFGISSPETRTVRSTPIGSTIAGIYLIFQILLPFRHVLYPGAVSWTEEGHNFSWHMKLRDKDAMVFFEVEDPQTGRLFAPDPRLDLTPRQLSKMSSRPQMILQYAHHLRDRFEGLGVVRPVVRVYAIASLNGRPYQYLIDPKADLSQQDVALCSAAPWIVPLEERQPVGQYLTSDLARRQRFESLVFGRILTRRP